MKKSKFSLIFSVAVSLTAVFAASVSTYSWFQIQNSVTPGQTAGTKNLRTNVSVHQDNSHPNDDTYQTTPTTDAGGTLSYDHSKGGEATNFYLRQYNSGVEAKTLQMYTNLSNTDDKAVYYNIKFDYNWKIYDASTNAYYGYSDIDVTNPLRGSTSGDGYDNIVVSGLTGYYDVYFTSSSKIWFVEHSEVTVSDELGNETGYYIYGTPTDANSSFNGHTTIENGIAMYVNAATNTTDLAFYAGLRPSTGDVFYLASGDTTESYKVSDGDGANLLNNNSYFSFNTTTGAITCNQVGYYCIALNSSNSIFINAWDGKEADGSTYYTVNDGSGNPLNKSNNNNGFGPSIRKAPTYDNTKLNMIGFQMTTYDPYGYYWIHIWGGASGTTWPGYYLGYQFTTDYTLWFDASAYVGWTGIQITRRSSSTTSSDQWATTGDISVSANTKNFFKVTWTDGSGTLGHSEERRSTIQEFRVLDGTPEGSPAGTGYCWNSDNYTPTLGATPSYSGYVFKGWYTDSSCTSPWTSGTNVAHDRNLYAKFASSKTVSFSSYKMDTGATTTNVVTAKNVEYNTTFTFPAMPSAPTGYRLYDSKWHINTSSGSTSYAVGATSPAVTAAVTYYVLLEALSPCTVTYKKAHDGVVGTTIASTTAYQTASFTTRALPGAETGYTLVGWRTNPDGTGTSYNASTSYTCPSQDTLTLYACYTSKSYNYYLTGSAKGNWGTGSGAVLQTATYNATSVTWSNVSFAREETWKLHRPAYSEFNSGNATWWGHNAEKFTGDTNYFTGVDDGNGGYNIKTIFAGTYNITLTLSTGAINVSLVTLNADNFTLYQYDSSSQNQTTVSATRVSNSQFTFTVSGFLAGYYWHIVGPEGSYVWGYRTGGDNISATTNYGYWFGDSGNSLGDGKPNDIKNLYSMSCTVTFNFTSNSIVVSSISLNNYQFRIKTSSSTLATASATSNTGTVTFSNLHLTTDTPWYLEVGGNLKYSFSSLPTNVTMLGQATPKATYFYIADDGPDYIGTGYGGTYTLVFSVTSHSFTSVTCTSLDQTDFLAVRGIGSSGTAMLSATPNTTAHTMTYTGSTHLYLGESLYFKNDNNGSSSTGSCTHNYYFDGDINNYNLNGSNLLYVSGNYLCSRVDVTISYTFTFLATSSNTTKANFVITSVTENTDISFNHAEDAGIYIETATNNTFTSNVKTQMMHTTSNANYIASEGPVYTSSGTSYLRVYKTHSNNSGTTPTAATIRELTEYYYVAQDTPQSGFTSSTSTPSATGNGKNAYVTVTTAGTWTISLKSNGQIHIETYSGASTESTEHHVPYYLVGRGMPGSDIRGCDYTPDKGIQLYTWGNNTSNMGCYVGAYGVNGSSSNYQGTGISLKAGDKFKFSTSSNLITYSQSSSDNTYRTITSAGEVTIKKSGTYLVYLTGTVGSETIHVDHSSDGSDWTRDGDTVANNTSGVALIGANGNTLTFGGNLDYSLLDAYGNTGYTFVVCLDHTSASAGTVTYNITNSNGYAITVAKYNGAYNNSNVYSDSHSIAALGSYGSYTRTITASTTTYTCIQVTLSSAQIRSMINSGNYTFSMNISYSFVETTIS